MRNTTEIRLELVRRRMTCRRLALDLTIPYQRLIRVLNHYIEPSPREELLLEQWLLESRGKCEPNDTIAEL